MKAPTAATACPFMVEGYGRTGAMFPFQAPHLELDTELAKSFDDIIQKLRSLLDLGFDYTSAGMLRF